MVKIDVHGLFLKDAIEEILIKFDECIELGNYSIEIIHGHKHGTVIRNYIRSEGFIKDVIRRGHKIVSKNFSDKGATIFQLTAVNKSMKKNPIPKNVSIRDLSENKVQTDICHKCNETMILLKDFNWFKCPECGNLKKH